uniref:Uncharacterized protein n=1 Tax=Anguilla anguilla TaxID=7936 RepID=A0A0E9SND0_ANGAN
MIIYKRICPIVLLLIAVFFLKSLTFIVIFRGVLCEDCVNRNLTLNSVCLWVSVNHVR